MSGNLAAGALLLLLGVFLFTRTYWGGLAHTLARTI